MKKYREAKTDEEKKRGKSTDELSFKEALTFFKKRGKEKGLSKFRWRGDSYNVNGEKIGSKKSSTASTTTKSSSSSNVSSAPTSSKRPQARRTDGPLRSSSGGRGDGIAEMARRALDRDEPKNNKPIKMQSESDPVADVEPRSSLERFKQRRQRAKSVLEQQRKEESKATETRKNAPTFRDFFNTWLENNPNVTGPDKITAREKQREEYNKKYGSASTTPGMSKGGMVKSGNKDYKKSGMFYKSGSPRGYK